MLKNASKMRGIIVKNFGGIKEMILSDDLPIPEISGNQVLIKVKSSGVNPVDTYVREGAYAVLPSLPYTPGKDGAGIVESIGSNVSKLKVGDQVFFTSLRLGGTLAEFSVVEEWNAFPLSAKLSFDEGAAVAIPYFTAYRAIILKAKAQKGSNILIHGASGAVGIACIQLAKASGMTVIGTAGTEYGMNLVRSVGADAVYNHRNQSYLDHLKNNHNKFDAIIEMLANENLQNDMSLVASRGVIVIVGCRGDIKISPRFMMGLESSVIGCSLFSSRPEEWEEISDAILKGINDGWVKPIIGRIYSLQESAQAHEDIIKSKGAAGKLIVKIEE